MAGREGTPVKAFYMEKNILREDAIEKVIEVKDKGSVDNRQNRAKHTIFGTEENASFVENTLAEDHIPDKKGSLEKDDSQVNDIPKNEDITAKEDTALMAAAPPDWPLVEAAQVPLSKLTAGAHPQYPLNTEHSTLLRPMSPPKKTATE